MVLALTTISQAMAFEVKGSAMSSAFVVDEDCGYLSSQFVEETTLKAQEKALAAAEVKCGDKVLEQNSEFSVKTACSNYGAWLSITKLSVEVAADFSCR